MKHRGIGCGGSFHTYHVESKPSRILQRHVIINRAENIILRHDILSKKISIGIIATVISTLFGNAEDPGLAAPHVQQEPAVCR